MENILKQFYTFNCAKCGYEMIFNPSLAMRDFGIKNAGHGRCIKCNTFLHLEIDENDQGKSQIFEEWLGKNDSVH